MITDAELVNRFSHHPPDEDKIRKHEQLRANYLALAQIVLELVPEGREQSTALTSLEASLFWGNAGIARQD